MTFTFERRDEGFLVVDESGRGVASVQTTDIIEVTKDDAGRKLAEGAKEAKRRPREKWELHFTGYKFTPGTLDEFVKAFAAVE